MKVLNICYDDYANFAHDNANALRSVGVYCVDLKMTSHPFGYANQSRVATSEEIIEQIKLADIVQIFHSDINSLNLFKCHSRRNAKLVVYHTGTPYRREPKRMNELFKHAYKFTDQTEFMTLEKMTYIATAIDTDRIQPQPKRKSIGHYPSNYQVKGSEQILRMLDEIDIPYHFSRDIIPHDESLIRMGECEIYIELFKTELNGKPYGCFGVTAFEAASMGCVVVTQNVNNNVYHDAYGSCPFHLAHNEEDFKKTIAELSSPDINIQLLGLLHREWVVEKHSYKSTGNYLRNILEKI